MVSQDVERWRSAAQKLSQDLLQASKLLIWFYVAAVAGSSASFCFEV